MCIIITNERIGRARGGSQNKVFHFSKCVEVQLYGLYDDDGGFVYKLIGVYY